MKGLFLETVAACGSAKSHFIDVSLVYRKALTHFQAELVVGTTESFMRQHRANKNE